MQAPARAAPGRGQGDEGAHRLRPEDRQAHRRHAPRGRREGPPRPGHYVLYYTMIHHTVL